MSINYVVTLTMRHLTFSVDSQTSDELDNAWWLCCRIIDIRNSYCLTFTGTIRWRASSTETVHGSYASNNKKYSLSLYWENSCSSFASRCSSWNVRSVILICNYVIKFRLADANFHVIFHRQVPLIKCFTYDTYSVHRISSLLLFDMSVNCSCSFHIQYDVVMNICWDDF